MQHKPQKFALAVIWLLVAVLITVPTVWGKAVKDGKAAAPSPAPTMQVQSLNNPEFIKQLKKAAGITWRTVDERKVFIDQAKKAESAINSVYEAASSLAFESPFFAPGVLAETAVANFDTGGTSFYDLNANDRNPRQIAIVPGSRNVGIAWAKCPDSDLQPRNMFGTLWIGASKAGGDVLPNIPMSSTLTGRGGFGGAGYLPKSGKLFLYSHHAENPDGVWFAFEKVPGNFDWDDEFPAPDASPGDNPGQWPTATGGMVIDALDYDNDANTSETLDVIHFFSNSANRSYYNYSRGVDSAGTFIFPGTPEGSAIKVDSGQHIVATVVASKKSPKVALIWTSENACNSTPGNCSDVYYAQSTNGGDDWIPGGPSTVTNITNYANGPNGDRVRAMGDLMGVYNLDDSLIIAFLQYVDYDPNSGGNSLETDIMVWAKANGVRKAVVGDFNMPSYINYDTDMNDPRRFSLNWPHLAVHDGTADAGRAGYVYLIWTQFGGNDPASYNDTNDAGRLNAEIYVTVSTNSGKTWGAPQNLTKSHTPACTQGNCSEVTMSSCAELCDDTLHIMYMSDLYGGSRLQGTNGLAEGTDNPLIYMKAPAYDPVANYATSLSPGNFIQNPDSAVNLNDTVLVENIGNANLVVDSVEHNDAKTWLTITDADTNGFTILEGDPAQLITFRVNDLGLTDGVYFDTIKAYISTGDTLIGSSVVILVVDNGDAYVQTQFAVLDEGSIKISVSNVSNLANQSATTGFYRIIGGDTTNNLFDATKFVSVISSAGDTVGGRYIFGDVFMLPLAPLYTKADTTLSADKVLSTLGGTVKIPRLDASATVIHYAYARCEYAASVPNLLGVPYPGPWFGLKIFEEWFWRKGDPRGLYWVQRVIRSTNPSWWPSTAAYNPATTNVYIGKAMDWDVYTTKSLATTIDNYGRPVPGTGLMWAEGAESTSVFLPDSMLSPNGHFGYAAFLGTGANIDPYAMHFSSSDYFGVIAPGDLYRIASDPAVDTGDFYPGTLGKQLKYFTEDTSVHDSLPTDLRAVMTDLRLTPSDPDTIYVVNVLGTVSPADLNPVAMTAGIEAASDDGCKALARIYNKVRRESGLDTIPDLLTKLKCSAGCAAKPGDANASNTYTLGDIISTVNYIFNKPGCTPVPLCWLSGLLCRGDWNGSGTVTLGDAIQGVNYIFTKPGGPWFPVASGSCCTPYNAP